MVFKVLLLSTDRELTRSKFAIEKGAKKSSLVDVAYSSKLTLDNFEPRHKGILHVVGLCCGGLGPEAPKGK